MKYEWDEGKREANLIKHGVDFQAASDFIWENAIVAQDSRQDYQEHRYTALGLIDDRLHLLVFTVCNNAIRIIGLRKANKREVIKYEKKTGAHIPS